MSKLLIAAATLLACSAGSAMAQDSVANGSAASAASVNVGADLTASGVQTAMAASIGRPAARPWGLPLWARLRPPSARSPETWRQA
jgi:hypothetical protein